MEAQFSQQKIDLMEDYKSEIKYFKDLKSKGVEKVSPSSISLNIGNKQPIFTSHVIDVWQNRLNRLILSDSIQEFIY